MTKLIVAVAFLALNSYTYYYLATEPVTPPRESFAEFPLELDGWKCSSPDKLERNIAANLGITDYLLCDFRRRSGEEMNVYVGYHATQIREEGGGSKGSSIHPPAHCLPGSGWDIIDSRTVKLDLPGLPQKDATAKRLVIAKGSRRQLVYYWYQSRGRVISEDWKKILYVGWDRASRGRTDGSLVRFTTTIANSNEQAAEAAFQDLAPHILTRLSDYVPE